MGGWLEGIIKDRKHPAREPLLWKNLFFGLSKRKKVKMNGYEEAGNSPLYMHPEILDDVVKYVYLPSRIENEWRAELSKREAPGSDG